MNWQPQLKYSYHGNMMRQVTVDHISLNIMEKSWGKKETFLHGFSYKERRIRFRIVKVDLLHLNVTSDQLPQNLPYLSYIHL